MSKKDIHYLDTLYPGWHTQGASLLPTMATRGDIVGIMAINNILAPDTDWQHIANIAAKGGYTDIIDYINDFYTINYFQLARIAKEHNHWDTAYYAHGPWYDKEDEIRQTGTGIPEPLDYSQVYSEDFQDSLVPEDDDTLVWTLPLYQGQDLYPYTEPEDILDPREFPERYPGMPGFQPQIEYDPSGIYDDYPTEG